ncbi:NAD(P)-dependent dehydrogenase (short-subunit alcohol dehydrogenase family) [Cupriavidus necator]|nr:NAD(P)-dependent dehydrogenase (short-subunit alcohol dehydrogenase family) [Cupriavidus necator]
MEGLTEALDAELSPLGIRATVVEPGFFRTDFLDASSLVRVRTEIATYADTVAAMHEHMASANPQQPGDPAKLAAALLALADSDNPPVRLPLGSDTVHRITAKNRRVESELAAWQALALSTDHDDVRR